MIYRLYTQGIKKTASLSRRKRGKKYNEKKKKTSQQIRKLMFLMIYLFMSDDIDNEIKVDNKGWNRKKDI